VTTAIHWHRRDFRLHDNTALNAALAAHDHVVPVYILSEWKRTHRWTGPHVRIFSAAVSLNSPEYRSERRDA
jgi:deoxyribodipyrimidine photolyase